MKKAWLALFAVTACGHVPATTTDSSQIKAQTADPVQKIKRSELPDFKCADGEEKFLYTLDRVNPSAPESDYSDVTAAGFQVEFGICFNATFQTRRLAFG